MLIGTGALKGANTVYTWFMEKYIASCQQHFSLLTTVSRHFLKGKQLNDSFNGLDSTLRSTIEFEKNIGI